MEELLSRIGYVLIVVILCAPSLDYVLDKGIGTATSRQYQARKLPEERPSFPSKSIFERTPENMDASSVLGVTTTPHPMYIYSYGSSNALKCESPLANIMDDDQCKDAARVLGSDFHSKISDPHSPPGCISDFSLKTIKFNVLRKGPRHPQIKPVCMKKPIGLKKRFKEVQFRCENVSKFMYLRVQKTGSTTLGGNLKMILKHCNLFDRGTNGNGGDKNNCTAHVGLRGEPRYAKDALFHPDIDQHTPFYTCVDDMLQSPVKLIMFRKPDDHLRSMWRYGLTYGVAFDNFWIKRDCDRFNRFEEWLQECSHVADNIFLQFLDPENLNLTLALERLHGDRMIVGIFERMEDSIRLFERAVRIPHMPIMHKRRNEKKGVGPDQIFDETLTDDGAQLEKRYTEMNWIIYEEAKKINERQIQKMKADAECINSDTIGIPCESFHFSDEFSDVSN